MTIIAPEYIYKISVYFGVREKNDCVPCKTGTDDGWRGAVITIVNLPTPPTFPITRLRQQTRPTTTGAQGHHIRGWCVRAIRGPVGQPRRSVVRRARRNLSFSRLVAVVVARQTRPSELLYGLSYVGVQPSPRPVYRSQFHFSPFAVLLPMKPPPSTSPPLRRFVFGLILIAFIPQALLRSAQDPSLLGYMTAEHNLSEVSTSRHYTRFYTVTQLDYCLSPSLVFLVMC